MNELDDLIRQKKELEQRIKELKGGEYDDARKY